MFSTPGSCRIGLAIGRSDHALLADIREQIEKHGQGHGAAVTAQLGAEDALHLCRILEGDPLPPDDRVPFRDAGALDVLYRVQGPRLLRFFSRRTDRQDAADLVQDSFVRFAQSEVRRREPLDQPDAYLAQVATNVLRNRARVAFHRTVSSVDDDKVADPVDLAAQLEARDALNRIHSAMQRLSPKTQEIFLAHRLDGATYAQIAARTGLSVKGVEWHMTKALRQCIAR